MDSRDATVRQIAQHLAKAIALTAELVPQVRSVPPTTVPVKTGLWTIEQVAEELQVSVQTIYNWRARRPPFGPPATQVGKFLRWKPADVHAWIDMHHDEA